MSSIPAQIAAYLCETYSDRPPALTINIRFLLTRERHFW